MVQNMSQIFYCIVFHQIVWDLQCTVFVVGSNSSVSEMFSVTTVDYFHDLHIMFSMKMLHRYYTIVIYLFPLSIIYFFLFNST